MSIERWLSPLALLIACLLFVSCRNEESAFTIPASYTGVIPCADCEGIRITVTFGADSSYYLWQEYLGTLDGDRTYSSMGRWRVDGSRIFLQQNNEDPILFLQKGANAISWPDKDGQEISSDLNYDLARSADLIKTEIRLIIRGTYSYMADAGRFRECMTGRSYPVAQEEENAALEREYLSVRIEPGSPVLVEIEARIVRRPATDRQDSTEAIVVERVLNVWPVSDCGDAGETLVSE